MFQLKKATIADQEIITIINPESGSTFSTIASLGSSLFKLRLSDKGVHKNIFKSWDDPKTFINDYRQRFPGSQLFPFPNRLANGSYNHNGNKYHFPHNDFGRPNALHGHLYDQAFLLDNWDSDLGILTLIHENSGSDPAYPFSYTIKNQFSLSESALSIKTEITNTSSSKIPFGYGWHPYFCTPKKANDYWLELPATSVLEVDKNLVPTEKTSPFGSFSSKRKILDTELDNCFFIKENGGIVRLLDPEKKTCISLDISQFEYLQVYIPPERDAIAIEPQSCAPDAFNNGMGLIILSPEERKTYTFKIAFSSLA